VIHISATNRGSKRIESDFYATPPYCIENLLNHWQPRSNDYILDPCAGSGNFGLVLKRRFNNQIDAIEIREEENDALCKIYDNVSIGNCLQHKLFYDVVITNPPYSLAEEITTHYLEVVKPRELILLLRTSFLESQKRYSFWQKHPVNKLYVFSKRPSFTNGGTDACSYSWFIWDNSGKQEIKVI
jgi:DNA modification methylase